LTENTLFFIWQVKTNSVYGTPFVRRKIRKGKDTLFVEFQAGLLSLDSNSWSEGGEIFQAEGLFSHHFSCLLA